MKRNLSIFMMFVAILVMTLCGSLQVQALENGAFLLLNEDSEVNGEDIYISDISSGASAIEIDANIVLKNLTIHLSNVNVTSVFEINCGHLELDNVSIVSDSPISTGIINNGGIVELNNVTFPYIENTITNNVNDDAIILHTVNAQSVRKITLNSGAVEVCGDTEISGVISLDMNVGSFAGDDTSFDPMIGRVLVKGKNTFARYYSENFKLIGAVEPSTDYIEELRQSPYYMDYVGDIGDELNEYNDGYTVVNSNGDTVDIIETGDLIFTKFKVSFAKKSFAGLYCTADIFLKYANAEPTAISGIVFENGSVSSEPKTLVLDNVTALVGNSKGNVVKVDIQNIGYSSVTVNTIINETTTNTTYYTVITSAKLGFFVNLGEYQLDSMSIVVGTGFSVVSSTETYKFVYVVLNSTDSAINSTINVVLSERKVEEVYYSLIMPELELEYNGQNRLSEIFPFYILNEEKICLTANDIIVKFNNVETRDIKNVGTYTIEIIENGNVHYDKTCFEVTISQKEITVSFDNDIYDYDGKAKSLSATLNGVCAGDIVDISYDGNSLTLPGKKEVKVSISNPNYILVGTKSHNLVINKCKIDMSGVVFESVTAEYNPNGICEVYAVNIPNHVNVSYSGIKQDKVLRDEQGNVISYKAYANFTVDDSAIYTIDPEYSQLSCDITINPIVLDMSGISVDSEIYRVYSGNPVSCLYSGELPSDITITPVYYYYDAELKEYTKNSPVNATNTYYLAKVVFEISNDNYELSRSEYPTKIYVSKALFDLNRVQYKDASVVFNGENHRCELSGDVNFLTVEYVSKEFAKVGVYDQKVKLQSNNNNYYLPENTTLNAKLTITKANYDLSGIKFNDISVTYDGEEHTAIVTGDLPKGLEIDSYMNNSRLHAGSQTAWVKFRNTDPNYNDVDNMSCTITIAKRNVDITLLEDTFVYNGEVVKLECNVFGAIEEVNVILRQHSIKDAGTYDLPVLGLDNNDYQTSTKKVTFTIDKADLVIHDNSFKNAVYEYDGLDHAPKFTGSLPSGVAVSLLTTQMINVGEYTAYANFKVINKNYNTPDSLTAHISIRPKSVLVEFSDYSDLVADGTEKSVKVKFIGVLETNFTGYSLEYSAQPIHAGTYTCSVVLNPNSNYEIIGDSTLDFEILKGTIVYLSDNKEVTIMSDGFSSDAVVSLSDVSDKKIISKINNLDVNVKLYDAFKIEIGNSDNRQEVEIKLKSNTINFSSTKYIQVFKVVGDELKTLDFAFNGDAIEFKAQVSDEIIIVEASNTIVSNVILSVAIIVLSGVMLVAIISLVFIFALKRKRNVKSISIHR